MGSAPESPDPVLGVPGRRLAYLDALRGVAVALVLVQHLGEYSLHGILAFSTDHVQLGQAGVVLFFACSGFIIPVSLERAGSLRVFWVNRVFRLYPLYWLSLALAAVLVAAGRYNTLVEGSAAAWAANVTMLQSFVGLPHAIPLYWSLAWELAFYAGMSVLFVLGVSQRSLLLCLLCNVAVCGAVVVLAVTGHVAALPVGVIAFPVMLLGSVLHRWTTGEVGSRGAVLATVATALTAAVVAFVCLEPGTTLAGTMSTRPMLGAWWLAIALFVTGVVLGPRLGRLLEPARRLGVISYSVYLLQALVISVLTPAPPWPGAVTAGIVVVATLTVSAASYRWLEAPFIRAGHRVARRVRAAIPAPVAAPSAVTPAEPPVPAALVMRAVAPEGPASDVRR